MKGDQYKTALTGVKYFSAVSTNKRFDVRQKFEEIRIEAMQRRMLGRVWKEKERLLNDFIRINVRTGRGKEKSDHIELKEMAVYPRLVLPMDLKTISLRHQTVIAPVISFDGRGATLYPQIGAKHGRNVTLSPKVFERMHKAKNISSVLERVSSGTRRHGSNETRDSVDLSRRHYFSETRGFLGMKEKSIDRDPRKMVTNDKRPLRTMPSQFDFSRSKSAPVLLTNA